MTIYLISIDLSGDYCPLFATLNEEFANELAESPYTKGILCVSELPLADRPADKQEE